MMFLWKWGLGKKAQRSCRLPHPHLLLLCQPAACASLPHRVLALMDGGCASEQPDVSRVAITPFVNFAHCSVSSGTSCLLDSSAQRTQDGTQGAGRAGSLWLRDHEASRA